MNLSLNNPKWLMCQKTKPNQTYNCYKIEKTKEHSFITFKVIQGRFFIYSTIHPLKFSMIFYFCVIGHLGCISPMLISVYKIISFFMKENKFHVLLSELVVCNLKYTLHNNRGCPHGVMVKAMDCRIVEREFVLQSRHYVHFRANSLGKGMSPLILPAMG